MTFSSMQSRCLYINAQWVEVPADAVRLVQQYEALVRNAESLLTENCALAKAPAVQGDTVPEVMQDAPPVQQEAASDDHDSEEANLVDDESEAASHNAALTLFLEYVQPGKFAFKLTLAAQSVAGAAVSLLYNVQGSVLQTADRTRQ